jgi:hypothetical protein
MRRREPEPWYTDVRERVRFERRALARHPDLRVARFSRAHLGDVVYKVTVELPHYEPRRVTIRLCNGFTPFGAEIAADGASGSPHRYSDGTLCLWHPDDPEEHRWVGEDGLDELITLVAIHLFKEAYWRETGMWLGPEAPHEAVKQPGDSQESGRAA